jgi:hypothetical protein
MALLRAKPLVDPDKNCEDLEKSIKKVKSVYRRIIRAAARIRRSVRECSSDSRSCREMDPLL